MGKVKSNRSKKKEICGGSGEAQPTEKKRKSKETLMDKDVNAKRSKRDAKSLSYQSLEWDDEDDMRVLQGMIDFRAVKGKNPFDDLKETYNFLLKYITYEDYSDEFLEKMRNLKKKLMDRMRKAKEIDGTKSSELLKLIFGYDKESEVEKPKRNKRNIKPKEEKQVVTDEGGKWYENAAVVRQMVRFGVDETTLTRKWGLVPLEKKKMIYR